MSKSLTHTLEPLRWSQRPGRKKSQMKSKKVRRARGSAPEPGEECEVAKREGTDSLALHGHNETCVCVCAVPTL